MFVNEDPSFVDGNSDAFHRGSAIQQLLQAVIGFYSCMWYYLVLGGSLVDCPYFQGQRNIQCHLYSMKLGCTLWDQPHYRSKSFAEEVKAKLRDISIPGTGIPLSILFYTRLSAFFAVFVLYPIMAVICAMVRSTKDQSGGMQVEKVCSVFIEQLLCPRDWIFVKGRAMCLSSLHHHVSHESCYSWRTLGCASYPRTSVDGTVIEWTVQQGIEAEDSVAQLFGEAAPFATLQVISTSRAKTARSHPQDGGDEGGAVPAPGTNTNPPAATANAITPTDIACLSAVLVAGRRGGMTAQEYMSCLSSPFHALRLPRMELEALRFPVDLTTGRVSKGSSNAHWYAPALNKLNNKSGSTNTNTDAPKQEEEVLHDITRHPDTGITLTGLQVPDMGKVIAAVQQAHASLAPGVPMVQWNVAFTHKDTRTTSSSNNSSSNNETSSNNSSDTSDNTSHRNNNNASSSNGHGGSYSHTGYLLEGTFTCEPVSGAYDEDVFYRFMEDHYHEMDGQLEGQ